MIRLRPASALLLPLLFFASAAAAQTGFAGQFEVEGTYSTRRQTKAKITIRQSGNSYSISRTGRFTSRRFRSQPEFTWTSGNVRKRGNTLIVTYQLGDTFDAAGLASRLSASTSDRAAIDALSTGNTVRGVYFLSNNGRSLREVLVNTTRLGDQRWWRHVTARGERLQAPAPSSISEAEYDRRVQAQLSGWWREFVDEQYEDEIASAANDAERRELIADRALDRNFDDVNWSFNDDMWNEWIDDDYADGRGYRDSHGRLIPRSRVKVIVLDFMPEFAGIGLSKAFVFDRASGQLLDEGDLQD